MKNNQKKLIDLMTEKSQQSFLLALELYNKPTIKLNVEGFCIFICNAWELMFKAYLLKNNKDIYYTDKGKKKNTTYDLKKLIGLIMTNCKDPARINLEVIMGIRNKATHLVIPEYASLLHDVFLANIKNYSEKMLTLLNININELFDTSFFSLTIPTNSTNITVLGKYGKEIQNEYYNISRYLTESYKRNSDNDGIVNSKFAISHELKFIQVKDKNDSNIKIAKYKDDTSHKEVKVVVPQDVNVLFPLTFKKIIEQVQSELKIKNITFTPYTKIGSNNFTTDTLNLYVRANNIKENKEFAYKHVTSNITYTYSQKLVEKIIIDITNDPDIFIKCKEKIKN